MLEYTPLKSLFQDTSSKQGQDPTRTCVGDFYIGVESNGTAVKIVPRLDENSALSSVHSYYPVSHRATYKILLGNHSSRRADVDLYIDNEKVGTWRVPACDSILIERPVKSAKKFTFLREKSLPAILSGIRSHDPSNGLIRAVFHPEKVYHCFGIESANVLCSDSSLGLDGIAPQCFSSGATVLGAPSHQKFRTVQPIREYDAPVTIHARLIVPAKHSRDTQTSLPLSNPVPPPYRGPFPFLVRKSALFGSRRI